jgi:hypothetical protein
VNEVRVDDRFSKALRAELVSRVERGAAFPHHRPARLWLAAAAVAGAAILGGTAAGVFGVAGSQQATLQPASPLSYKAEDTLDAFGGISHDYNPFHSPEELAAASQVIVQGTVEGVRKGRTGTGLRSVVLIVHTDRVLKGELPQSNDGNVYVELRGANSPDPLYFSKAFPTGAAAIAYMVPAWDGTPSEGTDATIDNPNAGRPDGQALFMTPQQGLILQVGNHDVVWPLIGERAAGKIGDALPGGGLIRG